jgi:hypothetical protein
MGIRKALARIRAAWVDADIRRRELEILIASYNVPAGDAAMRRDLDRTLDEILERPT